MIIFRSGLGCPVSPLVILDGLDLEMESDEGEHQTLEVLDEIVETAETVWVAGLVDVHQGPDLAGGEADVLVPDHDLQLLAAHAVRLRPQRVVLGHDLAVLDDSAQLVHHGAVDVGFLADHRVVLVVRVVGVAQLAVGAELELEELVTELALVADVVPEVEVLARHGAEGEGRTRPQFIS